MDISKLTDDSVFKKKESNIQQYINLIQDQKFFERMRADGYKDRNLLKNLGNGDSKGNTNPHSSKYGKSKSVSWREGGKEEQHQHQASEDFGNESEFDRRSKQVRGGLLPEVPHNDSKMKKRDEFIFDTYTHSSQQSETKPARKAPKKEKIQERPSLEVRQYIPDDTKSERQWNLPSLSRQTINASIEKSKERSKSPIDLKKHFKEDEIRKRPISAIKPLKQSVNAPEINLDKLGETESLLEEAGTNGNSTHKQAAQEYYEEIKRDAILRTNTGSSKKRPVLRAESSISSKQPFNRIPTITSTKREAAHEFYEDLKKKIDENSISISSKKSSKDSKNPHVLPPLKQTIEKPKTMTTINNEDADEFYEEIKNRILEKTISLDSKSTERKLAEDYYKDLANRALQKSNTLASNKTDSNTAEEYYARLIEKAGNATVSSDKTYISNLTAKNLADQYWKKLADSAADVTVENGIHQPPVENLKSVNPHFLFQTLEKVKLLKPKQMKENKTVVPYEISKTTETWSLVPTQALRRHIIEPLLISLQSEKNEIKAPEKTIVKNEVSKPKTLINLPPAQPSTNFEKELVTYRVAKGLPIKSESQSNKGSAKKMLITDVEYENKSFKNKDEKITVKRKNSPDTDINYSQIEAPDHENLASIDQELSKNNYDDKFKVPQIPDSDERGPIKNSRPNLDTKNSNKSLERGLNLATNVRGTTVEDGPSVHNIYGNTNSRPSYYTAEEMNRIRDQIKTSIEGMFDLRQEVSKGEDSELTALIARFYHLMLDDQNKLSKDKAAIIMDLVAFYQNYIKKLREDLKVKGQSVKMKDALTHDERERNRDLQREIQNLRIELKDAHEERLEVVKKMAAIDMMKRQNDDKVRDIEQKYEDNIEKFKDLLRNVNEEFLNSRKHEIQVTERLNILKRDYDHLFHQNIGLKAEVTNLEFKDKEKNFEMERILADLKGQITRNEALLREREILLSHMRDHQMQLAELESVKIEIENHRARENELCRNVESMRAEMRNKDLNLMDLQHRINYNENVKNLLIEENNRMIAGKESYEQAFKGKFYDMKDNMFSKDYERNKLLQSGRTIKKDSTDMNRKNNKEFKSGGGVRQIRNPIIQSLNTKAVEVAQYTGSNPYSLTTRGNSARIRQPTSEAETQKAVKEYNAQLYHYQDKKVILDSLLCRLPSNPRNGKEVELKESLENDYNTVINKIAEFKKLLRDLKAL